MESIIKDIRYGLRSLLKRPGFTAIALIALALGIGANTAIFSLVNAVVIRPLPYPDPDRLVWVWGNIRNGINTRECITSRLSRLPFSKQDVRTVRGFEHAGLCLQISPEGGEPERLMMLTITGNYFDTFRVAPALGRGFSLENEKTWSGSGGGAQLRALAEAFRRRSGDHQQDHRPRRQTARCGRRDGRGRKSAARRRFVGANELRFDPEMKMRYAHFIRPIGRLKEGVSLSQAQADTDIIAARWSSSFPTAPAVGACVSSLCANNSSVVVAQLYSFFSARLVLCC